MKSIKLKWDCKFSLNNLSNYQITIMFKTLYEILNFSQHKHHISVCNNLKNIVQYSSKIMGKYRLHLSVCDYISKIESALFSIYIFFLRLWASSIPGFTACLHGDWALNRCDQWDCPTVTHPSSLAWLQIKAEGCINQSANE